MALDCRVIASIQDVAPADWNRCAGAHPFVQHAFLRGLETSGALGMDRGVVPRHVLLVDPVQGLVACAPAMLKWGNKREFGPEIKWLKAGIDTGCFSWPKFQVGIPFFPVMGPKLLVRPDQPQAVLQKTLLQALGRLGHRQDGHGMFNVMHIDHQQALLCQDAGALLSSETHAMWTNPGYAEYADYVMALPGRRRYQLRKEQRKAAAHGLRFQVLRGKEITDAILADYYEGHRRVCGRHGGQPWLPAQTYATMHATFGQDCWLAGYFDGQCLVAGSLKIQQDRVLYALQWSELHTLEGIALDLICHRPIEYAIAHGLQRLDSGLDAAHKRYRNWQSTPVFHAHWFQDDALKALAMPFCTSGCPGNALHDTPGAVPSSLFLANQ